MSLAEQLNRDCFCMGFDPSALATALDAELGSAGMTQLLRERCPYVFAAQPIFVSASHIDRMAQVVRAIESVVALPAYRESVLAGAPVTAQRGQGTDSVFFGYDFHLDSGRLGLIEVNTNAGGAMLNAVLARAQRSSCGLMDHILPGPGAVGTFEHRIADMFKREWRLAGHSRALATIAIVDTQPEGQYLYPEFLLFERLFRRYGLHAVVADPSELTWRAGRLWHGERAIDLVYNRLTDFYFDDPAHAALREASLSSTTVVTPHPQAHALYANKRRLALFSDDAQLKAMGATDEVRRVLQQDVPHAELVTPADGERLWSQRRGLFFKPVAGYGGRAAYRGDKLTRRVWDEILAGDYIAQSLVPPGQRCVEPGDGAQPMKYDLRAYAYSGKVQWVAARVYQGQTTNFRTPGGGFAPVYSVETESNACA